MSETSLSGWLFDLYPDPRGGLVIWLLGDDGLRHCLHMAFPVTFYAAGPAERLRSLWRFLTEAKAPVLLSRAERRDLFSPRSMPVLAVQVSRPEDQPGIFKKALQAFPDLTFYDADISPALRCAAAHGTFPLGRCRVSVSGTGQVQRLEPLDTPWDLEPQPPPLRILSLQPDCDPAHAEPRALLVEYERLKYRFSLEPARSLLINLQALLSRHDPDLLLTTWGDTWVLPRLLELAEACALPLALNRDPRLEAATRPEHSYFSYGQIVYRGQQVHLFGRWHIDRHNALLFNDLGMDGILEFARVTGLPVQESARVSPGTGISSMQIITALRHGILVPWHKQQGEKPKTALDLIRRDQGGMIFQPIIGLHANVAEVDFISMYPSLMVRFNISPETAGDLPGNPQELEPFPAFGGGLEDGEPAVRPGRGPGAPGKGLVPLTLEPLLEKRIALKAQLGLMQAWDPRRESYRTRAAAHKWLLVTCFGYLGYKNARFGRIEAHEAVTSYSREAMLRAKEAGEDLGCTVLHLYVDGLWVQHPHWKTPADYQPYLQEIAARTGLSIGLNGVYRWVVFLPSRLDERVPVPNRYFGVYQDGTLKIRGIEARRGDTPDWISQMQVGLLECLAQAPAVEALPDYLPRALAILRKALADLRLGRIPLEKLVVSQKLSRVLEAYRQPSPAARAAIQLQKAGKTLQPGQRVRFLYTLGDPGVCAWDLPEPPDPRTVDLHRYRELLLRAASTVFQPMGIQEEKLNNMFQDRAGVRPLSFLPAPNRTAYPALDM